MKKFLSFILLAAFFTHNAAAQKLTSKKLNWGFKAGTNISNIRVNATDDAGWKGGLAAGFFFVVKAGNKFSIQPEFLYSSMGGKNVPATNGAGNYSASGSSLRLNYFSLPLLGRYQLKNKLALVAGPQIDLLIQAKTKNSTSQFSKATDNYREYSFNVTAGAQYWFTHCLGFSARYIYGLTNINLITKATTVGYKVPELKNQGFQLTAAIKL